MKIIVLVKQVPDTTDVRLDPKTGNLIREGVESIINPDDRHALEEAIRLKEIHGGEVVAVSMGPPQAIDAISEAMGILMQSGVAGFRGDNRRAVHAVNVAFHASLS